MGGRGASTSVKRKNNWGDQWQWLTDVSTDRLKRYIAKSDFLKKDNKDKGIDYDPQGRHIQLVAQMARDELKDRGV